MTKLLRLTTILLVTLGASLSACNMGTPDCTDLPASWAEEPFMHLHIPLGGSGTQVSFAWYYPGTCLPDHFQLIMNDIPYRGGGILYNVDVPVEPGSYARTVLEDGTTAIYFYWTTEGTYVDGYYWWWVIPRSGDYRGETSPAAQVYISSAYPDPDYEDAFFYSDNWCLEERWNLETNPELVYPANGSTLRTLTPTLIWRDRNPQLTRCLLPGYSAYLILSSQETDDLDLAEIAAAQPPDALPWWDSRHEWILPPGISLTNGGTLRSSDITLTECGRTYWQVNVKFLLSDLETVVFRSSETYYFDIDPALCIYARPPDLFIPRSEWVPPMAKTLETANCRSGPTTAYPLLSILPVGAEYEIRARNQAGDSWYVYDPAIGDACWVFGELVEVTGDTSQVPIIEAAPLQPTPTDTSAPVNCAQYNGQTCEADNHPCKWTGNVCVNE